MAFYDTYGDSQNRRLTQQAQNNQALQAFANFLQKGQENKSQASLQGAQTNYYNQLANAQSLQQQNQQEMLRAIQGQALPSGVTAASPWQISSINGKGQPTFKPVANNQIGDYSIDTTTDEGKKQYLATMKPEDAILVQRIANGEADLNSISLRGDQRRSVLAAAAKYDSTFNPGDYKIRFNTRNDFTSGKSAKAVNSVNTLVGHLGTLEEAYKEAGLGSFPLLNKAELGWDQMTGGSKNTKISQAVTAVSNELATVFKNTGATDQEINHWKESIANAPSPQQQKAIIDGAVSLLGSRMEALNQTYKNAFGKDYNFDTLSPKSRKYLQSRGLGFDTDNNTDYDSLLKKAGI